LRGGKTAETTTTLKIRRRIGSLLDRLALHHDEFVIERKGRPLAALEPIGRFEQMRRFARRRVLDFVVEQSGSSLGQEQATALALEAQRSARERTKRAGRRTG